MTEDPVFHRPSYAQALAQQLLKPGPLDQGLRSGVFISGIRRIGKTTFIRQDFVPALLDHGALVLYVDLWTDRSRPQMALMQEAVRAAASELEQPASTLLQKLRRVKGVNFGAAGISLGVQLDGLGTPSGVTLAEVFVELVRKAQGDVVLIIDEVQQAMASQDGQDMLFALKAARDKVNTATDLPGRLLIVGTGSHKSLVTDMATRRSQAFAGAHTASFDPLGKDYVEWFLSRLAAAGLAVPSLQAAFSGFRDMGSRPEELTKAVRQFQDEVAAGRAADADTAFATICATIATVAAELDIQSIEDAGELAVLAFSRIAAGQGRGLYAADTLTSFSESLGREVSANDMTPAIDKLVAANLIVRKGHGSFDIADPFVKQVWLRHAQMRQTLIRASASQGTEPTHDT
ncbi:MAG: ATP-binding protein [Pseudomonadota bacterium]|nr:ATP-binding protein [Burkholderiales bacterium]MCA3253914.1 ATP-binding protein [Rubrivivax sp.]MCA3260245.1 ATP-binding protein [Rubrivivax sp.]MCZ8031179.1 ATP-binding protein [Rubrivivax sp.]